jgi:hypothetical protein
VSRATTIRATTSRAATKRVGLLDKHFYFFMSLLIAVVVVYGFSYTVGKNLIHPVLPRPFLLYVHAAVFSGWVVFLILQSTLVQTHHVIVHRLIGWFGVALGVAIPVLGISTAITMTRFDIVQFHITDGEAGLIVPFFDISSFVITFALAIYWRKKPEFHRRLILLATCALTAAAFARFPLGFLSPGSFYAGVDLLILLGIVRDWIVNRRVHPVYVYGLAAFVVGQMIIVYTAVHNLGWWLKIAHAVLG